jgi:mannose-6-phosphate isomerase-like protein (cupin superfamily)
VKAVKIEGEFVWHSHPETDELFFVHRGLLFIVPRGVEHKPAADEECEMLLIEPAGTPNTGSSGGPLTREPSWI